MGRNSGKASVERALRQCRADGGGVEDDRASFRKALDTVMDYAGRGAATADLYSGGMLSTLAGMVPGNSVERARESRDKALEGVPRDMKSLASEAILVGPAAVTRLRRSPDAWGSMERLSTAQKERAGGRAVEDIWREHGWSDNAFGHRTGWHSAIDDTNMKPTMMFGKSGATVRDQIDHPVLADAYPELMKVPLRMTVGSTVDYPAGKTVINRDRKAGLDRDFRNSFGNDHRMQPFGFSVEADSIPPALSTAVHEFQHGAADIEKVIPQGSNQAMAFPLKHTDAYRKAKADLELAQAVGMSPHEIRDLERRLERVASFGGYYNDPGEMIARGEQAIYSRRLPVTTPRQHSDVDVYDLSDFLGRRYDFSNYRPD